MKRGEDKRKRRSDDLPAYDQPRPKRRLRRTLHSASTFLSLSAAAVSVFAAIAFGDLVAGMRWTLAIRPDTTSVRLATNDKPLASVPVRPQTNANTQSAPAPASPPPATPIPQAAPAVTAPPVRAEATTTASDKPADASPAAPPSDSPQTPTPKAEIQPPSQPPPLTVAAAPEKERPAQPEPTSPAADATRAPAAPSPEATPKPLPETAKDKDHLAAFDALIAPVRDAAFSTEDATRLRNAFVANITLPEAKALRDQLKEPAAQKLIDWSMARAGMGSAQEIKAFATANPDWPSQDKVIGRSEEQLFASGGSVRDIKNFFDKGEPKTGLGMAALSSAYLAEGDEQKAIALATAAWRRKDIPATLETGFLERFGRYLKPADHKARFDAYLIDNARWMPDRNDRATTARRLLPLLTEADRKKAEARLAIYLRQPTADALVAALPADTQTAYSADWGFAFQLTQWHLRAGRFDAAAKILRDLPAGMADAGSADDWWELRRGAAYEALKAGKPQLAYDLVKSTGPMGVNPTKDQTFLAGYIALRQLNDPQAASEQFKAFEGVADGPLSRAKAGYWLARSYEAGKNKAAMQSPLERAARNIDTFYGQLARLELSPQQTAIKITPPRPPTPQEAQHFNANDLVRAAVLSRKANLERWVTRALLGRLSATFDNEGEQGLLAHLAEALGDTQMAVHIGKAAVARGYNLLFYSYPTHAMPAYKALRPPIEPALMLAITRQETEFDASIVSGAGARGLMQVMNVTAEQVCHDHHVTCELDRLGRDPSYNVMMASAYIADRLDEFKGSYVLTIPGYNAGPGRVRQWLKEFGDPRTGAIEPIDWIHRIPFEETREYVQKVLSNLQIYRARLGEEENALRLTQDLRRTGSPPLKRAGATDPRTSIANN